MWNAILVAFARSPGAIPCFRCLQISSYESESELKMCCVVVGGQSVCGRWTNARTMDSFLVSFGRKESGTPILSGPHLRWLQQGSCNLPTQTPGRCASRGKENEPQRNTYYYRVHFLLCLSLYFPFSTAMYCTYLRRLKGI
jgi:hypothetical protein